MRFWFRELAGWLLVLLGLFVFFICTAILITDRPQILSSGPIAFIGFIIFRGGIHLLKVAVAARVVLHGHREMIRQQLAAKNEQPGISERRSRLPLDF